MYVVTVDFAVRRGHESEFRRHMVANAGASRGGEPGCLQFDVMIDPSDAASIFLYEVYADRAAFDAHVATEHYRAFERATRDMIARKTVRVFDRIDPA
jgi:(4S)-4-hydroxy-5-phosphonooxypentane-2,3-dione isomerase